VLTYQPSVQLQRQQNYKEKTTINQDKQTQDKRKKKQSIVIDLIIMSASYTESRKKDCT
jgi:hypothetical protein